MRRLRLWRSAAALTSVTLLISLSFDVHHFTSWDSFVAGAWLVTDIAWALETITYSERYP